MAIVVVVGENTTVLRALSKGWDVDDEARSWKLRYWLWLWRADEDETDGATRRDAEICHGPSIC